MAKLVSCPNPNMLATAVKDIPRECLEGVPMRHQAVIRAGKHVVHWAIDQYRAIPAETKELAAKTALRIAFPFGGMFIKLFEE